MKLRTWLAAIVIGTLVTGCQPKKKESTSGGGTTPTQQTTLGDKYKGTWTFSRSSTNADSPCHFEGVQSGQAVVDGDGNFSVPSIPYVEGWINPFNGNIVFIVEQGCGQGSGTGKCTSTYCSGSYTQPKNTPYGGSWMMTKGTNS